MVVIREAGAVARRPLEPSRHDDAGREQDLTQ